jgi:predicted nucleic acid-binding protein
MTVRSFVDTNVWVHAVDGAEAAKQQRARSVLEGLDSSSTVVSAQVLNEYYVAVTRKLAQPLSQADATTAVRGIADLEVVAIAGPLVLRGIDVLATQTSRSGMRSSSKPSEQPTVRSS